MTRNRFLQHAELTVVLVLGLLVVGAPGVARAQDDDEMDGEGTEEAAVPLEEEDDGYGTAGFGLGQIFPYEGDYGKSFQLSALNKFTDTPFRLGIEFAFAEFEAEIAGVENLDAEAYALHVVGHYLLPWSGSGFEPYVGGGLGLILTAFDDSDLPPEADSVDNQRVGLSALLLGGVEYLVSDWIVFYVEGRISYEAPISSDARGGGWGYAGGVRIRH